MQHTINKLLESIRTGNNTRVEIILGSGNLNFNKRTSRLIFLTCIRYNNNETIKILKQLLKNQYLSYDTSVLRYIIRKIHHTNKAVYFDLFLKYKNRCYRDIIYDIIDENNYRNSKKENKKLCIELLLIFTSRFNSFDISDKNNKPYTITDYYRWGCFDDISTIKDSVKIINILINNRLMPYNYDMYQYFAIKKYQKPIKVFLSKNTGYNSQPCNRLLDDIIHHYNYKFFKFIIQNELINPNSNFNIEYTYLRIDRHQNSLYNFYCCNVSILYGLIARYYNMIRLYNEFADEKEDKDKIECNNLKKMICLLVDKEADINRCDEKDICIESFINDVVVNSWAYEYYDETTIMMFLDDKRPLLDLLIDKGIVITEV